MCGRFALTSTPEALAERFGLSATPVWAPRYNVGPGQAILAVRGETADARESVSLRWGWLPSWARDPKPGPINARFETAGVKPSFRAAFAHRRCVVPIDGYYEWEKVGGVRHPYWHSVPEEPLLAVAALWERWKDEAGRELATCALLTVPAVGRAATLHDRMPLLLGREAVSPWLAARDADPDLDALFDPGAANALVPEPVHPRVGRTDVDDPSCLERVAPPPRQTSLF